jgi:hypothetical protein
MESTQSFLGDLLSHGIQMGMDPEDKPNPIVEAALGYSTSVGVALCQEYMGNFKLFEPSFLTPLLTHYTDFNFAFQTLYQL